MNPTRSKTLGLYILVGSFLQICLYLAVSLLTDKADWLLYFDPRAGIFFVESRLWRAEQLTPGIFQWLSAFWIVLLGLMLLLGRPVVKTYIISEIILSIPSFFFFLASVWETLSPEYGSSVEELLFPLIVMIAFSVVPLVLAFRSRRKALRIELPTPARA